MDKPLVSVILPAYNHARYVEATLDSIAAQDYPNLELVAINDGSKDDTHAIMEAWIEAHSPDLSINYRNRENRGISATLNELLSMARGRYIAGASSDDLLLENSISSRVDYLLEHPDKRAVFGDYTVIDDQGNTIHQSGITQLHGGRKECFLNDESMKIELLSRFCVAGPVLMFDRTMFGTTGFYEESLAFEDWDMYLRMAAHHVLGFVDRPVAAYRWHDLCTCRNQEKSLQRAQYERGILERNKHLFTGESLQTLNRLVARRKRKEFDYRVRTAAKSLGRLFRKDNSA